MDFAKIIEDYIYTYNHSDRNEVIQLDDSTYEARLIYTDEEIEGYLGTGSVITLKFSEVKDATDEMGEPGISFVEEFVSCTAPALNITVDDWNPTMAASMYDEVARSTYEHLYGILKNAYLGEVSYITVS